MLMNILYFRDFLVNVFMTKMSFYFNLAYNILNITQKAKLIMIRQYPLKNKFSQEELTEEIGISWRHLQRLEHNDKNTRISTLKK